MIHSFILFLLVLSVGNTPSWSQQRDLRKTVEFMSSLGSRVSGYPGAERAASYVENALRSMTEDLSLIHI